MLQKETQLRKNWRRRYDKEYLLWERQFYKIDRFSFNVSLRKGKKNRKEEESNINGIFNFW